MRKYRLARRAKGDLIAIAQCGAHSIDYRVEADGVEIIRILKHQDPSNAF